ncbi:hypothetical protein MTR_3g021005 [Medicago truncatula]|uniref:Uncharacterized protein n=1 Tax=Medicago truncatula TaxID=3880 RepID=A0A072UTW8_MEDTR|nr:hypothetical protein MTR_3g021005 [Medicago truncatula]
MSFVLFILSDHFSNEISLTFLKGTRKTITLIDKQAQKRSGFFYSGAVTVVDTDLGFSIPAPSPSLSQVYMGFDKTTLH